MNCCQIWALIFSRVLGKKCFEPKHAMLYAVIWFGLVLPTEGGLSTASHLCGLYALGIPDGILTSPLPSQAGLELPAFNSADLLGPQPAL